MRAPKELSKWVVVFTYKLAEGEAQVYGYGQTKKEALKSAQRQSVTYDDTPDKARAYHIAYTDKGAV